VWDLCEELFTDEESTKPDTPVAADQAFMLLSTAAVSQSFHPRTLQFQGLIQGQSINILLDSGSTNSFLDTRFATSLSGVQPLTAPTTVKVADGGSVPCNAQIQYAEWSIKGYKFHSTLKFIPIGTYDMILGMDWLQAFSPMKVHWLQRWVQIPYGPQNVVLQGTLPEQIDCYLAQLHLLSEDSSASHSSENTIPPEIQSLLDQYQHIFQMPTELPPRRACCACDHTIPLIPGAQPVSARPYRYSPALKSEIETQVTEMLQSGFIRPEYQCLFFSNSLGQEEGQQLAFLRRLPPTQRTHCEEQVPHSDHR